MTILPFIKKEFNFLTFCFAFQNNSWKMTPNATSVSCSFFYWWLMTVTQRKLQRFWTPFLSVNSFQLLWKNMCEMMRLKSRFCFHCYAWAADWLSLLCCLCAKKRRAQGERRYAGMDAPNFGSPLVNSSSNSADLVGTSKNRKILDDFWG